MILWLIEISKDQYYNHSKAICQYWKEIIEINTII